MHGTQAGGPPVSIFQLFDAAVPVQRREPSLLFRAAVAGRAHHKRTWAVPPSAAASTAAEPGPTPAVQTPADTGAAAAAALATDAATAAARAIPESELLSGCFGDDAYFIRADALGVADGVSGWRDTGTGAPALYSRLFMHHCALKAEADGVTSPQALIEHGHRETTGILGSSTVMVVTLEGTLLRMAHIGDCGMLIVRDGAPLLRTVEQQHDFNFPFQLGAGSRNSPADAATCEIRVRPGDVVILGSDGLFDNLFDEEIVAMVTRHLRGSATPRSVADIPAELADDLVAEARDASLDRRRTSPFELRAVSAEIFYEGGKPDDICVIVAIVVEGEDTPDRR